MTYSTGTSYDFSPFERGSFSRDTYPHTISGAVAFILSILVGGAILYVHSIATPNTAFPNVDSGSTVESDVAALPSVDAAPMAAPAVTVAPRAYGALLAAPAITPAPHAYGALPAAPQAANVDNAPADTPAAIVASNAYGALLDPAYSTGFAPVPLGQSAPLAADFAPLPASPPATVVANVRPIPVPPAVPQQLAQSIPLPTPRPPELRAPASRNQLAASGRELAEQDKTGVLSSTPPDHSTLFDRLFGTRPAPSGPMLAYAAPEDGIAGEEQKSVPGPLPYDHTTAVYDISAHTVYMPDGTRLEAHSGRGDMLDDPRYVNERMRGPTPPDVYDLQLREQPFHGVQALRLIPVGNSDVYGRAGLLAHTYMLGPNGDSFGCVSFRDYRAFLQAYLHGEVKRLTVVARLN
jgi:hypothetical protein